MTNEEILAFLKVHLQSIQDNDIQTYHETTAEDLTLYEWWITPHRIDGLPFHEFMMTSNAERGTVFGAEGAGQSRTRVSDAGPVCCTMKGCSASPVRAAMRSITRC